MEPEATTALEKYLTALPFLLMNARAREMKAGVSIIFGIAIEMELMKLESNEWNCIKMGQMGRN